ncbi:uncharacterized protein [Rutidosis leptorrhynchoides]|uniref:uncharacterized protein n=1 Tax=Rutidosis leptorrhynchoides TaxID=125765 RepID=UPI003A9A3AE0
MDFGPIPFKCYNTWNNGYEFVFLVNDATLEAFNVIGLTLHDKIKIVKDKIECWSKQRRSNGSNMIEVLMGRVNELEALAKLTKLQPDILENICSERLEVIHELDKLERDESIDLKQKSRVKWDVEGDKNSKFFHSLIKQRQKDQMINGIKINEKWITTPDVIKNTFLKFYKVAYLAYITQAFRDSIMPKGVVSAFLTLRPKVSNPSFIKDYHTIFLISATSEVITKILTSIL